MKSLDPRVNRLPGFGQGEVQPKAALDQLGTYEVFVQAKEGKPFQHEGIVHASDIELAYILAKETFTRRFTCVSLYVTDTRDVYVSPLSEGQTSAYDLLPAAEVQQGEQEMYEVYHLVKRGKQHVHAGEVSASSPQGAMQVAKQQLGVGKVVYNVWVIRKKAIRYTTDTDKDLWLTLPDKKYRDASDYKAGDKLTAFLEKAKHAV
ncbi:phenylacetic acid degradation b [Chryseotalea sanaruensis]|uniref:Phenylacetic acid degradation b n=1 Tax=Chryseotalea sanaruensis TaxID=2482724 RepID=A0A401UDS9_9BACT|nr:phenylacetic acid degradation b [Chryseotalea sanaruensis]GCC53037.1 phenylacetic acid degradation b [Chryseotalea sanaruensis]